jgi:hypothetical protein
MEASHCKSCAPTPADVTHSDRRIINVTLRTLTAVSRPERAIRERDARSHDEIFDRARRQDRGRPDESATRGPVLLSGAGFSQRSLLSRSSYSSGTRRGSLARIVFADTTSGARERPVNGEPRTGKRCGRSRSLSARRDAFERPATVWRPLLEVRCSACALWRVYERQFLMRSYR